jgi:hypothetical protein
MPSVQEMSDRFDIQQLIIDYANALDQGKIDLWDDVFTPDAFIDYSVYGGAKGRYPEVKAWIQKVMPSFKNFQHMVGNMQIRITGDTATGRTVCFNPMECDVGGGKTQVMFLGLWYVDKYVRTPKGWRIAERVEEKCYDHNVPTSVSIGS